MLLQQLENHLVGSTHEIETAGPMRRAVLCQALDDQLIHREGGVWWLQTRSQFNVSTIRIALRFCVSNIFEDRFIAFNVFTPVEKDPTRLDRITNRGSIFKHDHGYPGRHDYGRAPICWRRARLLDRKYVGWVQCCVRYRRRSWSSGFRNRNYQVLNPASLSLAAVGVGYVDRYSVCRNRPARDVSQSQLDGEVLPRKLRW